MIPDNDIVQPEVDLERTDRLPILDSAEFDDDVGDDSVLLEHVPVATSIKQDFSRPSAVDLPSLADSVRSVEERIARQNAEFETLNRAYENALKAEAAATTRAEAIAAEQSAAHVRFETEQAELRGRFEAEQARLREAERAIVEKNAALEVAHGRVEQAARDSERLQQVLHSLGERDAQLNALQREHAKVVPALEERTQAAAKLAADLAAARTLHQSASADLQNTRQTVSTLSARLETGEQELRAARHELTDVKAQAAAYLENLSSREWRRGFDENMFRELDARIGAAQGDRGALQSESDALRKQALDLEAKLAAREQTIAKLQAEAVANEDLRTQHRQELQKLDAQRVELVAEMSTLESERLRLNAELTAREQTVSTLRSAALEHEAARTAHEERMQQVERTHAELNDQMAALELERNRLNSALATRDAAAAEALAAQDTEAQRQAQMLGAAQQAHAELLGQLERLRTDAQAREEHVAALTAGLAEARKPLEPLESEVKHLTEELAAKVANLEQLTEDNKTLRASLERARGALEEREFLIRRLERSESNNAQVLGRIQTSIERLGTTSQQAVFAAGSVVGNPAHSTPVTAAAGSATPPVECIAELVRIDGNHNTSFTLGRRTRIGRAPGCELQVESTSVSRHHALFLTHARDVIVEDLNSTNGVLVNGRKVSRQLLSDGDLLTIGEAQFRLSVKFIPRIAEEAGTSDAH